MKAVFTKRQNKKRRQRTIRRLLFPIDIMTLSLNSFHRSQYIIIMTSDESDDEPLSVIAANKQQCPEKYIDPAPSPKPPKKKKKKYAPPKRLSITIKLNKRPEVPSMIERPADVWLYLKDLNPTGPYSCLLCSEWFINKSKVIIHYVLNHKKDFCGICRYFVPDRELWWKHMQFHSPWPCSQCIENFQTEPELRIHLRVVHNLVHCRLCHFRVPDGDPYNIHLFQKHNVSNVASKDEELFWQLEYEGSTTYACLLCSKSNNSTRMVFNHYMGYHHFTLKCFTAIISGRDCPFVIYGAEIRAQFVEDQLRKHPRYGYVDLQFPPPETIVTDPVINFDTAELLKNMIPEIKHEVFSGDEDKKDIPDEEKQLIAEEDVENSILKTYNGEDDFDVTLTELIVFRKSYYNYADQILKDIDEKLVHQVTDIDYEKNLLELERPLFCPLCKLPNNDVLSFLGHMLKMHLIKSAPVFSCRVCATPFDSRNDLDAHISTELGDFEDLWLCQFCDKEFDDRASTRKHLTEHWSQLDYENCFSPHLGFKCRHCPTLFWHETDRESHQVQTHYLKHTEYYYKCEICSDVFSDQIWFIHHYLQKHHTGKLPIYMLKCTLCCLVLPDVDEMRNHFNADHPEARKVFCSLDGCKYKPLSHRKSFKLHLRTVHNPRSKLEKPALCAVCCREFTSSRAYNAHIAQAHGPGKFKCKLCKEMLHTIDERKLHYLINHPGQHPFECNECGKSFQYKSSLYMHKQEHVPNKQTFTCNYCGKIFVKRDSYREHIQIHEGPQHACSYCPMRFVQRSNMLRHERRHTGERPYACPHCPRSFADKGACTSHARTHSKDTSYGCMYCGKTFVQKSKLTYHIRKHTGENLETCPVCSKLFTSACSLREHMKVHNEKKAVIKCPLCERMYQDERYMLRHLRTAHTHARHPCPLCDKNLTSPSGLRHHVITHSKLKTLKCKLCPKRYSVKRTMLKHFRRRHGFKGNEPNIKEYFSRMDPRECNLPLSEEVMTSIFGPPPKPVDILVANYVTLANRNLIQQYQKQQQLENEERQQKRKYNKEERDEQSSDDSKEHSEGEPRKMVEVKVEGKEIESDHGDELEPTDFVSVKIEPMEEDDDDDGNGN